VSSLDFTVQVRRRRPDRSEFDGRVAEPLRHNEGEELSATVRLNALNRKRHFFHHALEKRDGVNGGATRIETEDRVLQSSMAA
jgi:hypothetical protein